MRLRSEICIILKVEALFKVENYLCGFICKWYLRSERNVYNIIRVSIEVTLLLKYQLVFLGS